MLRPFPAQLRFAYRSAAEIWMHRDSSSSLLATKFAHQTDDNHRDTEDCTQYGSESHLADSASSCSIFSIPLRNSALRTAGERLRKNETKHTGDQHNNSDRDSGDIRYFVLAQTNLL